MKNNFMRLPAFSIVLLLLIYCPLLGQEAVSLQYGSNDRVVLPLNATYQFPAFTNGTVFFRDGTTNALKLNYNVARDEMYYINIKGDTLLITEQPAIASVLINRDRFFYSKDRWLQEIGTRAGITLAFRQAVKIQLLGKLPYSTSVGLPDENSKEPGYFTGDGQKIKLDEGRVGIIRTTMYYYFGDKYGFFAKASKAYLLRNFERQESAVREFIKSHHSNFDKMEDLLEVLQFCDQLK
ncbi:MAG TPA: hypothetical protein VK645_08975 [Chitinophagaceae bacterium]|nr:hypothetical protein [Chitinophagaceae bacterium]